MAHNHSHTIPRNEYRKKTVRKAVLLAFAINALLMALKLIFGVTGHSDALVADGFHSLYDFASGLIILIFISKACKEPDDGHPYGHGKIETIISLGIGVLLLIVAFGIASAGISSVIDAISGKDLERPDAYTIIVALAAILAKEFLFRYNTAVGKKANSAALLANAWHERGDAISSIATLTGVCAAYFLGEKWRILDPVASLFIAVIIAVAAWRIVAPAIAALLDSSLPSETIKTIRERISAINGVNRIVSLKSRMNGPVPVLDIVIAVDPDSSAKKIHAIVRQIKETIDIISEETPIVTVETLPEN